MEENGNLSLKLYNAKVEFSGKIRTGDSGEAINLQRTTNSQIIERSRSRYKR